MTYDPYRHAYELGVSVRWDDDAPALGSGYDEVSRTITLPTMLSAREARTRLAILLVYAETPDAGRDAHAQLVAMRKATSRLVQRERYYELTELFSDRRHVAEALGVSEEILSLYERLTATRRDSNGYDGEGV